MRSLGSLSSFWPLRVLCGLSRPGSFRFQAGPPAPSHMLGLRRPHRPEERLCCSCFQGRFRMGLPSPRVLGPLPCLPLPGAFLAGASSGPGSQRNACYWEEGSRQVGLASPGYLRWVGFLSIRTFPPSEPFTPQWPYPWRRAWLAWEPGSPSAPRPALPLPSWS